MCQIGDLVLCKRGAVWQDIESRMSLNVYIMRLSLIYLRKRQKWREIIMSQNVYISCLFILVFLFRVVHFSAIKQVDLSVRANLFRFINPALSIQLCKRETVMNSLSASNSNCPSANTDPNKGCERSGSA